MTNRTRADRLTADRMARRTALGLTANPDCRHDYLIRLAGTVGEEGTLFSTAGLVVRYVPDRAIVDADRFPGYCRLLAMASDADPPTPEALALTVLDDFNDRLVPRWLEVAVSRPGHRVVIEDRQPDWDNPALLARLWRY